MSFYDDMQVAAADLLADFKQGEIQLRRVSVGTPPNEWTPGTPTTVEYDLFAVASRLHQRYEKGVLIIETGDMVTFSPKALLDGAETSITPIMTDLLIIDGSIRAITSLKPVPSAGTVVVWKAWCAL